MEIKLRKGEPIDRGLRRLRKKMDREDTLFEVRKRRYYRKPSEKKRQKLKEAKFAQYLKAKEDKLWR
jgi:small subunit ribosomal protein S21